MTKKETHKIIVEEEGCQNIPCHRCYYYKGLVIDHCELWEAVDMMINDKNYIHVVYEKVSMEEKLEKLKEILK